MIKIIRDMEKMKEIESEWNELSDSCQNKSVFQLYDWNFLWLKYFLGKKDSLYIIAVYNDAEELEAIAPFYTRKFLLFFKSLIFISSDYSDYLDVIIKKGADTEKIYSEIFGEIVNNNPPHVFHLKQISGELLDGIQKVSKTFGMKSAYKESGDCYYFKLPDNIDDYMKRFNSKQRYNILSRVQKAEKNNIKFFGPGNIDKSLFNVYLNYFFDLHQKRWSKKGEKGVFYNKKIKSFFTDIFTALFNDNKLALFFLRETSGCASGNAVSSAVCFDYGNKRQVYLPGFDPEYSDYHPGIVLTYHIIKEAIEKKYEEFDFLKGGEDYKQRFGAVKRGNYKAYIYKYKIFFYAYKFALFTEKEILGKLRGLRLFKILDRIIFLCCIN